MKKEELIEKICECLMEESENITPESELDALDGWDSVGRLMTVSMLSDSFNIEVNAPTIAGCKTIDDIIDLVIDKLDEQHCL